MLVSHRHRFIFVKTRKTAGTSLELALSRHLGPDDIVTPLAAEDEARRRLAGGAGPRHLALPRAAWGWRERWRALRGRPNEYYNHMPAAAIRRALGIERWAGYFKFAVERNPWDLAVSAYHWHLQLTPGATFGQFVASRALLGYRNWPLYAIGDRLAVDEVIRYETLAASLPALARRLGMMEPLELPRAKADFRLDRRPYQEWYGAAERERIARVFAREIAVFGWTFD